MIKRFVIKTIFAIGLLLSVSLPVSLAQNDLHDVADLSSQKVKEAEAIKDNNQKLTKFKLQKGMKNLRKKCIRFLSCLTIGACVFSNTALAEKPNNEYVLKVSKVSIESEKNGDRTEVHR